MNDHWNVAARSASSMQRTDSPVEPSAWGVLIVQPGYDVARVCDPGTATATAVAVSAPIATRWRRRNRRTPPLVRMGRSYRPAPTLGPVTASDAERCPEPVRVAVMRQQWLDLAYVHWRYDPAVVQALLPAGLTVDTFDGSAWVGLIPFSMRGIGLPHGPAVPYLGSFAEVNVRTYVRVGDRAAVWFWSLDVDRLLPAVVARLTYRLPYCWGRTSHVRVASNASASGAAGDTLRTVVRRRWPERVADSSIVVEMGEPVVADPLDVFLTARWGLASRGLRGLRYAPVDHEPWPLRTARLVSLDDSLVQAAGLPAPQGDPHVRCSDGVSVRIGRPVRVRR